MRLEVPLWRRCVAVVASAAMLGGCASLALPPSENRAFAPPTPRFAVSGRLAARYGTEGLSAHFRWTHDNDRDVFLLSSPLGETVARMVGAPGRVELERANGTSQTGSSWSELTTRGIGWPLPVEALAWWVQGAPQPGVPFAREAGADPAVLRQSGWTIVYAGIAAGVQGRPFRLTLSYPEIEVRLVVDAWE